MMNYVLTMVNFCIKNDEYRKVLPGSVEYLLWKIFVNLPLLLGLFWAYPGSILCHVYSPLSLSVE